MTAVDQLLDRLAEQRDMANQLVANPIPGGSVSEMLTLVQDLAMRAGTIPRLMGPNSGGRGFAKIMHNVQPHLRRLGELLQQADAERNRVFQYRDDERKALAKMKRDLPSKIAQACEAAIALLESTMAPAI
jgi:hypothetical protein